jgi:hypothetical protein
MSLTKYNVTSCVTNESTSVCGEVTVAQQEVPAEGHTWVNADCDTPKTCSVCGATEGEALGHSFGAAYSKRSVYYVA